MDVSMKATSRRSAAKSSSQNTRITGAPSTVIPKTFGWYQNQSGWMRQHLLSGRLCWLPVHRWSPRRYSASSNLHRSSSPSQRCICHHHPTSNHPKLARFFQERQLASLRCASYEPVKMINQIPKEKNQPNQSIHRPINLKPNQSINQSIVQCIDQRNLKYRDQSISQQIHESNNHSSQSSDSSQSFLNLWYCGKSTIKSQFKINLVDEPIS